MINGDREGKNTNRKMFKLLKHLCSVNISLPFHIYNTTTRKRNMNEFKKKINKQQQQEQIINKLKISQFQINFKWQIPLKML